MEDNEPIFTGEIEFNGERVIATVYPNNRMILSDGTMVSVNADMFREKLEEKSGTTEG